MFIQFNPASAGECNFQVTLIFYASHPDSWGDYNLNVFGKTTGQKLT